MPFNTNESSDRGEGSGQQAGSEAAGSGQHRSLKAYITSDMFSTTLFVMRMITIICSFIFLLSMLGITSGSFALRCYTNAFLAAFFTFSIRLFQRKKQTEVNFFSRQMLELMTIEDSGHYMLYSFFYYHQTPLSIYLLPVFFYAALSSVTYTQGLLPFLPSFVQGVLSQVNLRISGSQRDMKRFIAYTEIFLMPIVLWNAVTGYMFILGPFMHYHFLKLRYTSRRNPSVRIVFSDLRLVVEQLSRHPRCPTALASLTSTAVAFFSRLAPVVTVPGAGGGT